MFGRGKKDRETEPPTVGWDAITALLDRQYPGVDPFHHAPVPGPQLGGGVQGISAYPAAGHWHLVTYGLTELYGKESEDLDRSGWGYELTLRVSREGEQPPPWAFNLLERVAVQTQQSGTIYDAGHRIDVGAPIDGSDSQCTALAFTLDSELGSIETDHGAVDFLQVVGITAGELSEMKISTTAGVLERLTETNPLLIVG